jgi:peptidoglycan/LPS O-acetylase OafA/YrhL
VRLSVKLSDTWPNFLEMHIYILFIPVPIGVARGPLRATVFLRTLVMAASGIAVLPSLSMGVTSTGSHSIGTLDAAKIDRTESEISGPMPSPGISVTVYLP